jgi:hypothetical protein
MWQNDVLMSLLVLDQPGTGFINNYSVSHYHLLLTPYLMDTNR